MNGSCEDIMAYIKVPSWLEVVNARAIGNLIRAKSQFDEASFWKEQTLRFGFDLQECQNAKNYFYTKFFQYTLKRIDYNLQNLTAWEKAFWRRHGKCIDSLELVPMGQDDLDTIISWCPNLEHLVLKRCNALIQSDAETLKQLSRLKGVEIYDAHLITEKAFKHIPASIESLTIVGAKSITNDFFYQLSALTKLRSLTIKNCHSLGLHQLSQLPQCLLELDLSGSGASIQPDACFYLPRALKTLKMNGWDHFGDDELALVPKELQLLEVEGWNISASGLKTITQMPLKALNISRIACDDFYTGLQNLPKSLETLYCCQNSISSYDLEPLAQCTNLKMLDLSFSDGPLDECYIPFPKSLETLHIAYSGALHKKTIQSLKGLANCKMLSLAGSMIENSDLEWLPDSLEHVDLALCTKLTDVGIMQLGALEQLKSLILDGCDQIRGIGLQHLAKCLKKLSLAGCNRLSGKSLRELPKDLEELSLDSCELVMVEDIDKLPAKLQTLSLARCITLENSVAEPLSTLPLLHKVSFEGCPKITEVAIAKLVRRKFEGTIIINADGGIELHPPISILRKLTNFKARFIHALQHQVLV